eukprot:CAMPEP_0170646062 /NCGR_PEP_ID=MMETSP0224-20130122/43426_1 /TAXON_ID=285029 /ORGANISM="Togula jolla, Strain CCCM 725" /LENGTH=36 /DNA_ID= /DNA_START= /DNA_END= /DNA_ORIENTATION=
MAEERPLQDVLVVHDGRETEMLQELPMTLEPGIAHL